MSSISVDVIIAIVSFILGLLGYGVVSKIRLRLGYIAKGLRTAQHYLSWGVTFTGILARLLENLNKALEDGKIDKGEMFILQANIESLERVILSLLDEIKRFKQNVGSVHNDSGKSKND